MRLSDIFPGRFLTAGEVAEEGEIFTITEVTTEEFGQEGERQSKPVVHFEESPKGLVLNKTNFTSIAKVTGESDTDAWAGHQVTLYPTEVQFQSKMVECIRVKTKVSRTPVAVPAKKVTAAPKAIKTVEADSEEIPF